MLRVLTLCLPVFLLITQLAFAKERLDFFKEEIIQQQPDECSECSKLQDNLNPELKKKIENIQRKVNDNFANQENQFNKEIILFIDPDDSSCDAAVNALVKFKKDFPGWKIRGVITAGLKGLKQKLIKKQNYFSNDIVFSVDLKGNLARKYNIDTTPAYVIGYKGKYYKVSGQPDLNETIAKLDK